jgi:peptidyl-prolyl cis-trans isomerase B (cyclophilin B)
MVIDGMDVVDEIVSQPRNMITNKPKKPQVMKSVTVDTHGVEYPEPDKLPDSFHK